MSRDCNKCIHHISGSCSVWKCDMQTLDDYKHKIIDNFAERIKELSECVDMTVFGWNKIVDDIAEELKAGENL